MKLNILKLYLKNNRPLIASAVIFILVGSLIANSVLAANPRFNFEALDLKTLIVANRTQNSGWQNNSVSANSGDQVAFQVYYRNGVADSIANNTRVRLTFPANEQGYISVMVSLSADNAPTVTDTVVINSAVNQRLNMETSNIRWYPDRASTPTYISSSSSGSGYIEVNLGDIGPCWEHQGYVTFYATLAPALSYNFSINKNVRNVSLNQVEFYDLTNASTGDRVEFEIRVQNTGSGPLSNLLVSDSLPAQFSYITGSTRVNNAVTYDGITGTGIDIGSLNVGATTVITFQAELSVCSEDQTLTNYAWAQSDRVLRQSDTAKIRIVVRTCAPGNPVFRPIL